MINHNRNMYNTPMQLPSMDLSDADNTSAIIDSLVKNLPNSDSLLEQFATQHFGDKNSNTRLNHAPGPIYDRLHRISTDKVTEEMLNSLSRLDSNDFLAKCSSEFESLAWNGAISGPMDFQSQNRLALNSQGSIDKNGNSAVFNSTHGDKIPGNFGPFPEHIPHNNFSTRPSPSASVESNVHTPTTSSESASPLSSNRTPIRSDESISPMGSGHTPLRMDDSTSPLASVKTPMRIDEGSPLGRTPLRTEEGFSPAGTSSTLPSVSPSHKLNGQTPQRCENYSSPPSFPMKKDVRSPVLPSPVSKSDYPEEPKEERVDSESKSDSAIPTIEALIKTNKKIPIPFVSAKRIDDPVLCKKAAKRTLPRKSDSDLYLASSSLPGRSESEPETTSAAVNNENEISGVKTETEVPEAKREPQTVEPVDAQKLTQVAAAASVSAPAAATPDLSDDTKGKKKRKTPENNVPTKRCRKKVTIYQSSMSPEETGIKLKIKLAPSLPPPPRIKKRRSKKNSNSGSDDEEGKSKKTKKSVRFSPGTREPKESESSEQSEWGSRVPPEILQRIFQYVIDDQGCVPSLVRLSTVCKLWNSVSNRSELWQNIDLSSPYIKQKCRIDRYFRWLLENRLENNVQELNLNGWKFSNITMILSLIGTHCTDIESIGFGGWQGLHFEHLKSLLQDCPKLGKLDLSDVSPESKTANSAVSQKSITYLTQTMGERLTQLILANNTLTCLPQIITSLATHCPNLQILDLSNVRRVSHTEFALNVEHLQEGCPNLRILRITNSCITLANVPLEKQVASPGFVNLEELSIAGHQGTESLRITSVMDDNCLERILKCSNKLKLLDVRGCTRITDSSLVRVPAWDIQHLFLSGCYVTRQSGSGLELIAQKWSHSLLEIDLAWTTVTEDLDAAVMAFAEKGSESPLRNLNLCGSSVTLEPVKAILTKCVNLESLNLQSCRGLPRGMKRLYENEQLAELRSMLDKKDRDSVSESEDRKEMEQSPACSTNTKDDDLVT